MVSLFRKKNEYQGFSKYSYEAPRATPSANTDSASAGQAAMAALRMHGQTPQPKPNPIRRSNSLTAPRSNSLQTYVYHPKGLYVPGQRAASLRSNTRPPVRSASFNRNSYHEPRQNTNIPEEENVVITTKTTKVIDSLGRTQSITTETIRTMPDGLNVIETTTKNMSRANSRNNSMMSGAYNLQKIDEDLRDFEYNYELDEKVPKKPTKEPEHFSPGLKLNVESPKSPIMEHSESVESSPSRPLKSILKNKNAVLPLADEKHPYSSIAKTDKHEKTDYFPKKASSLQSPISFMTAKHDEVSDSPNSSIKFSPEVETIPIPKNETTNEKLYEKAMQVAMERVYGAKDTSQLALAPPAAIPEASPAQSLKRTFSITSNLSSLIEGKNSKDRRLEELNHLGVEDNYKYQNHHKEFTRHSLRDAGEKPKLSRKERAKEEKKKYKEEQEREKQRKKLEKQELKAKRKSSGLSLFKRKEEKNHDESFLSDKDNIPTTLAPQAQTDLASLTPLDDDVQNIPPIPVQTKDMDTTVPVLTKDVDPVPVQTTDVIVPETLQPNVSPSLASRSLSTFNPAMSIVNDSNKPLVPEVVDDNLVVPSVAPPSQDPRPGLTEKRSSKFLIPIERPVLSLLSPDTGVVEDVLSEDDTVGDRGDEDTIESVYDEPDAKSETNGETLVVTNPEIPPASGGIEPTSAEISNTSENIESAVDFKEVGDNIDEEAAVVEPSKPGSESLKNGNDIERYGSFPTIVADEENRPVVLSDLKQRSSSSSTSSKEVNAINTSKSQEPPAVSYNETKELTPIEEVKAEEPAKKPSKPKKSKFKQKFYKYFINTYDK